MTKILAFAGSLRKHAYSKRVVKTAAIGAANAGAEVTFVDLLDFPMPIYNEDVHNSEGFSPVALDFQKLLNEHDGFLICTPEYNGSLPGGLKNAIDWASRKSPEFGMGEVFRHKSAAIISSSPGSFGGIRALAHIRTVLSILGLHVLPSEIAVTFASDKFDGDGEEMTDTKMSEILKTLGTSLTHHVESQKR